MEAPIPEARNVAWPDEFTCAQSATRIAASIESHDSARDAFIELHGPLGAGKTTFARHLLHALGVVGTIKSPSYSLMEPYQADPRSGGFAIAHFDFYRFDDPQEWEDAGFREVFASPGLKVCEWPEKAAGLLPLADLRMTIVPGEGDRRDVRFEALSAIGVRLLP